MSLPRAGVVGGHGLGGGVVRAGRQPPGRDAQIAHYSADGVLVGQAEPGEAMGKQSGWFDNHACVAANRDSRDGLLDVFAEDDYTLRIGWYRVDDGKVTTVKGTVIVLGQKPLP